MEKEEIPLNVV